jgi:hypothetical protein
MMVPVKPFTSVLRSFKYPLVVLVAGVGIAGIIGGPEQALIVAILAVLEISLSFDNAVINASVLRRLNSFWQTMFMTVGMVIAVVGMRLVFPVVIVALTSSLSLGGVIDLIAHHPVLYGQKLDAAHPAIAAFGGIFLTMIFLDFLLDEGKRVHWINLFERPLAKVGRLKTLSTLIALLGLMAVAFTWGKTDSTQVIMAGLTGLITYLAVRGFSQLFENLGGVTAESAQLSGRIAQVGGKAALILFLYLEVLDASFSFDSVVGAFAITSNILVIALGLGIGAYFVRELTVVLVRKDTLREFRYLEHGAHYAVGALAFLLAASLRYHIPEAVTGLVGALCIALSVVSSISARKLD